MDGMDTADGPEGGVEGSIHAEDLGMLKTRARELRAQLDLIRQRIEEIEKGGRP
jgi:4-alpha-glucanotransferase